MAESSARRVVVIAAIAGALVGGIVAGGVVAAGASGSGSSGSGSPAGSSGSVTTTPVVRTDLSTTVQVGGSIGYGGSYTVAAPSGSTPQQVTQGQQAVTQDQQALAADEMAESDATGSDDQAASADQTDQDEASAALTADEATESKDCAGTGGSAQACTQDTQKVSQDQTAVTQAEQQLAAAESTAKRDRDQNEAKVTADQTKLADDQTSLSSLQAAAANPGTAFTALPAVGQTIEEDQPVYSVSDEPVPLLYGAIPAYRAFYAGMADGADVGELTQDLIALGFGAGLTPSDHFSAATTSAVERWQDAMGLPATGQILLGEVVFEPGPIRVTTVTPTVGAAIGGGSGGGGGTVLTATSTTPIVTVALDVTQQYLVKPGDAVTVVLPDGTTTVGGHIETVGDVATCPGGSGTGTGGSSADESPCASSGSSSTPTVTVTVTLDDISADASLDQAPVDVDITTQQVDHVLAVPVDALLALAGGGFGVDVVDGGTSRLVGVTTGLYSQTLVQVSGAGINAGTRVEVPSS